MKTESQKSSKKNVLNRPYLLSVYKPKGMSSQDVVKHFKWNLPAKPKKIGHFGTLDPFAEGVLLLGINGAQRLNDLVHSRCPKTYLATGQLGVRTISGDLSDPILEESSASDLAELKQLPEERFYEVLKSFKGNYLQTPPQISAVKFEGKPLHYYTRKGIEIKKDPVTRVIYSCEIVSVDFPFITFRASVSSGTYIRKLFEDFSEKFGVSGALKTLVREGVGPITHDKALKSGDWPTKGDWPNSNYIPMDEVLSFDKHQLNESDQKRILHGHEVQCSNKGDWVWLKRDDDVWALAEKIGENTYRPKINFSQT